MRYELRVQGDPPSRFETEHEALEAAAKLVRTSRNAHLRIVDLAAGHTALLSGPRFSHEEYKRRLSLDLPSPTPPPHLQVAK